MNLSLNEVEATAKRAARGAGYAWGLAEEAGKVTRWLCANGQDGVAELVGLLDMGLASADAQHAPAHLNGVWASDGTLCPLRSGALLSDCASRLTEDRIELAQVAVPMLLLPFAAGASRGLASCVTITCDGQAAVTDGRHLSGETGFPSNAAQVTIQLGGSLIEPHPHQSRAAPDKDTWVSLNRFAHCTYAPATEESRKLGAGAGLSDND